MLKVKLLQVTASVGLCPLARGKAALRLSPCTRENWRGDWQLSHSKLSPKYQVVETRSGTMILSVLNYNSSGFGLYVELFEKLFGSMLKSLLFVPFTQST